MNFKKSENNKLFLEKYKLNENIHSEKIKYFKSQKWSKDTWDNLIHLNLLLKKIKNNCPDIKYGLNLTRDSYYYVLISEHYKTFQKMPFFDPNNSINRKIMELINQNIFETKEKNITNENLLIVAEQKFLKIDKYKEIEIKYSYNHKQKSIYLPKKCNY